MTTWLHPLRASPARTVGAVTLALAVLSGAATFLTGYYHDARLVRAQAHLKRGQALVTQGELASAIVELRAALTLNRHDPSYALTLATTLLQNDLPREAEPYLDEAIESDPTSGPANLARAHVARSLGSTDAATYYQRAYFGSWPIDQQASRLDVGFELAEYLLDMGERERARGMLAQLAVDVARSADAQLRVAQLLVRAGAPQDAEPLLRDIVERRPGDEVAWSTLARVSLDGHEYASAIDAAERWLELQPKSADAAHVLRVAREVRALDSTGPRLSARERTRRATVLLRQTLASLDACAPPDPTIKTPVPLRADVLRAIDPRARTTLDDDQILDLAMRTWALRQERCPGVDPDTEVLSRVFASLAAKDEGPS